MSETLITGQTSEDLLADFETLLNSGTIDLSEEHQIVIITSPSNEGLHPAVAPTSTGEILLFATPQGPADIGVQDKRRPVLGRPPVRRMRGGEMREGRVRESEKATREVVKRKLDLDSDHQYVSTTRPATGQVPPSTPAPPRVPRSSTEKSRYDTSLNLTTKRFLNLLSQSADGVVDLNWASQVLDVQKRRIYDITNVLEGIQLISKKSKNNIQWLGNRIDASQVSRHKELQREVRLGYVRCQDLRQSFDSPDQLVMVVRAPPETQMQVTDPSEGYQVSLRSTQGPIDVFLCPEDSSGVCSPMTGGSPSQSTSDPSHAPLPTPPTEPPPPSAHTGVAGLDVGVSSPASTSSTVTAASQQEASPLVLGGDTESLLGGDLFSSLGDIGHFDLSPLSSSDLLNGEGLPLPLDTFINLSPPYRHDYHFGLEDHEGISELFDCDFDDLSHVLGDG
ncbi:hypothetical protein CCH79_00017966, partial [Gambusia affinis]